MSETEPFIPGFETVQEALQAGREFYAKTNGAWGALSARLPHRAE